MMNKEFLLKINQEDIQNLKLLMKFIKKLEITTDKQVEFENECLFGFWTLQIIIKKCEEGKENEI